MSINKTSSHNPFSPVYYKKEVLYITPEPKPSPLFLVSNSTLNVNINAEIDIAAHKQAQRQPYELKLILKKIQANLNNNHSYLPDVLLLEKLEANITKLKEVTHFKDLSNKLDEIKETTLFKAANTLTNDPAFTKLAQHPEILKEAQFLYDNYIALNGDPEAHASFCGSMNGLICKSLYISTNNNGDIVYSEGPRALIFADTSSLPSVQAEKAHNYIFKDHVQRYGQMILKNLPARSSMNPNLYEFVAYLAGIKVTTRLTNTIETGAISYNNSFQEYISQYNAESSLSFFQDWKNIVYVASGSAAALTLLIISVCCYKRRFAASSPATQNNPVGLGNLRDRRVHLPPDVRNANNDLKIRILQNQNISNSTYGRFQDEVSQQAPESNS